MMTAKDTLNTAVLPASIRWSLVLGLWVHVLSYLVPIRGFDGRLWGEMYWLDLLPRFLDVFNWSSRQLSLLTLYIPLIVLIYLAFRWSKTTDPTQKVPRPRWLILGLMVPNMIIPPLVMHEWLIRGRSLVKQEMVAYFIWNASFWLLFYGFWRYYQHQQDLREKNLSDHLIDEV